MQHRQMIEVEEVRFGKDSLFRRVYDFFRYTLIGRQKPFILRFDNKTTADISNVVVRDIRFVQHKPE